MTALAKMSNALLRRDDLAPGKPNDPLGDREGGFVSLYVVVITMGLLAMAGLVIDGGNAIAAREQAFDAAQQAARAGADALTPTSLRGDPRDLEASPLSAQTAVDHVLNTIGVTGAVSVTGNAVTVTVTVTRETTIMSAFGVSSIHGRATATAAALYGTTVGSS